MIIIEFKNIFDKTFGSDKQTNVGCENTAII